MSPLLEHLIVVLNYIFIHKKLMATYPTTEVSYGQTSADVKTLQNFLISQGYSIPDGATGYFGNETQAALSQWQSANGISSSTAGYGTNWGPLSQAAAQKSTTSSQTSQQSNSAYPSGTTTQPYSTGGTPAAPVAAPGGYTYNNQSYAYGTGPYATQFPAPKQTTTSTNQNNQTGQGGTGTGTGSGTGTGGTGTGTGTGGTGTGSTGTGGTGTSGTGTGGTGTSGTGTGGTGSTSLQAGDAAAAALEQQLLAAGMSSTGNASLDAIQLAMATQLQNMINSGQMINPNIALSPSDVQAFLTQATNNLAPDMQNQIQQILTPLQNSISALQNQYETDQQTDLQNFQQNLAQQENTNAGYGLSQSSVRDFANLNLVNSANTQLGSQYNSYVNQAANLYNTAQNSVGGAALPATQGFSPYAITSANRGSLVQEGTNNTYFQPSQSIAGSIEAANQVAIQKQAESAAGAMLQQRALPFYTASSTT